jgi:purine nucleoside permease
MKKPMSPFRFTKPLLILSALAGLALYPIPQGEPIKIRAVIVAMFESGNDTGDRPGEFQFWVEREKLDQVLPFRAGYRDLRINARQGLLGVLTGAGVTNACSTIMALGMDPRFDLSKSYWLIAGIAGVDPEDASLGSAAWANYVLDGDLVKELDSREAPAQWPYARLALGSRKPNEMPRRSGSDTVMFQLNSKLVDWAYSITKDLKLMDTPEMASYRARYKGFPKAVVPPFVLKGDSLGSSTYWHGKIMNRWANDWVKLWTGGQGNYVMTNMEDNGTVTALSRLAKIHKVDFRRVLVLRTASNYSMQAPDQSAEESVFAEYAGGLPSLESAYLVGSTVLHQLLENWSKWEGSIPGE